MKLLYKMVGICNLFFKRVLEYLMIANVHMMKNPSGSSLVDSNY